MVQPYPNKLTYVNSDGTTETHWVAGVVKTKSQWPEGSDDYNRQQAIVAAMVRG